MYGRPTIVKSVLEGFTATIHYEKIVRYVLRGTFAPRVPKALTIIHVNRDIIAQKRVPARSPVQWATSRIYPTRCH